MTDEAMITTSEIAALLNHSSPATTRSWIKNQKLEAKERDIATGEKKYSRAEVLDKIAEMPRGPYDKERPPRDHDRGLPPD